MSKDRVSIVALWPTLSQAGFWQWHNPGAAGSTRWWLCRWKLQLGSVYIQHPAMNMFIMHLKKSSTLFLAWYVHSIVTVEVNMFLQCMCIQHKKKKIGKCLNRTAEHPWVFTIVYQLRFGPTEIMVLVSCVCLLCKPQGFLLFNLFHFKTNNSISGSMWVFCKL